MATIKGTRQDMDRAARLAKEREESKAKFSALQEKIKDENQSSLKNIDSMFSTKSAVYEQQFKATTVGLVTADEFRKKREMIKELEEAEKKKRLKALKKAKKRKQREREKALGSLSFGFNDGEGEGEDGGRAACKPRKKKKKTKASSPSCAGEDTEGKGGSSSTSGDGKAGNDCTKDRPGKGKEKTEKTEKKEKKEKERAKSSKKCPFVSTDFLPDRAREEEEQRLKESLQKEWKEKQEKAKNEIIDITYSYYDGSGHRKQIKVTKGTTVGQFLEKAREKLQASFHELRYLSSQHLMYIKEDLIIPHNYTFYHFISSKARGKSGPLFHFDVHDDIRLVNDATVEKDESHPGKIVTRSYYERNQHIFPVDRWEVYDPNTVYDKYTVA